MDLVIILIIFLMAIFIAVRTNRKSKEEDIISIEPTDFFDIQMNAYYFEGFNKTLIAAQKQCQDLGIVAQA